MADLPELADIEESVTKDEYDRLAAAYEKNPNIQTTFNLAWAQIKSDSRARQEEGLERLTQIFKDRAERRRECLWYLALGNYKLGNYTAARRYMSVFVDTERNNAQAKRLLETIDRKIEREGLMGIGIVALVTSAVGVLAATLFMKNSKR